MSAEEVLVARLRASTALAALVGTKIHGAPAPRGVAAPLVTYQRTGGGPEAHTIDRVRGLDGGTYAITAWAGDYQTAHAIGRIVVDELDALDENDAPEIAGSFWTTSRDVWDRESALHGRIAEFDIHERR